MFCIFLLFAGNSVCQPIKKLANRKVIHRGLNELMTHRKSRVIYSFFFFFGFKNV